MTITPRMALPRRGVALAASLCLLAAAVAAGCGPSAHPTSVFLTVEIAAGTTAPEELRISAYDARQAVFVDRRLPESGPLTPTGPTTLGTATIYLLPTSDAARLDVRGLTGGLVRLQGTKTAKVTKDQQVALTVVLATTTAADTDGDGVPDPIDNCAARPNANQADANGDGYGDACPPAGVDGGGTDGAPSDGQPADGPTNDGTTSDGTAPDGTVDVTPTVDGGADIAVDGPALDAVVDAGAPDVATDVSADTVAPTDVADAAADAGSDAKADATADATVDAKADVTADAGTDAGPTGVLTIATVTPRTPVDLTAEGTIDWIHWGASSTTTYDHKASSSRRISDLSPHAVLRYTNAITTYAWSDGTPTASASTPSGVYTLGGAATFTVTVPATTSTSTLRLYLGVNDLDGKLAARLSDDAAPAASYSTTGHANGGGAAVPMEIKFHAGSAGQTLTLVWTPIGPSSSGYISINAATLF